LKIKKNHPGRRGRIKAAKIKMLASKRQDLIGKNFFANSFECAAKRGLNLSYVQLDKAEMSP